MQTIAANRKGAKLWISEIYASRQGEGLLTGTFSTFVRTSGCNLRCWFCDTRFASWEPTGEHLGVTEIMHRIEQLPPDHVVLTGGEPLIDAAITELCSAIHRSGRHLTIETAGTVYQALPCELISISPKLSDSGPGSAAGSWQVAHEQRRERLDVVQRLMDEHAYQLKFVVDSPASAQEVLVYLQRLRAYDPARVMLMPQGTVPEQLQRQGAWLEPWCQAHGLRFCSRAHIAWYGNRRGT